MGGGGRVEMKYKKIKDIVTQKAFNLETFYFIQGWKIKKKKHLKILGSKDQRSLLL